MKFKAARAAAEANSFPPKVLEWVPSGQSIIGLLGRVALNYNTPQQVERERLSRDEARQYLREGQFPPGNMGPKIEAAVAFVESGGKRAVVCRPGVVVEALAGRAGTVIK
ncbi:carbamate kinase [Candidatus Methanophagaceae archaeon]|nr:carbamate kinase [Methanophagales archaeon]